MQFLEFINIINNEESTLNYLFNENVFSTTRRCPKCRSDMLLVFSRKSFRCGKKNCRLERSIFKKTFFEKTKLKLNVMIYIIYNFLYDMPIQSIIETSGVFSEAVCNISSYVRQLLGDNVDKESVVVGGEDIIVEVDETKLGKRKYNKGHRVEGVWVIAGVERTFERKIFVQEVENRNEETITNILKVYLKPGSIVYTDGWKPYVNACKVLGLRHQTVNHSKNYVNPIDGTHTNTIEGNNNSLKIYIKPQHRIKKYINEHLWYFIWKRQNNKKLWEGFIQALKDVEYE